MYHSPSPIVRTSQHVSSPRILPILPLPLQSSPYRARAASTPPNNVPPASSMDASTPHEARPSSSAARYVLTRLFASLPTRLADGAPATGNPLKNLGADERKLFMTLHVLYPNELLPALDLLDRALLTRMCLSGTQKDNVRSAAQSHSNPPLVADVDKNGNNDLIASRPDMVKRAMASVGRITHQCRMCHLQR